MKTFEERYTEWIDGELRGEALASFEAELTRRAQVGEAEADKVGAQALRGLLRDHMQAPSLSNGEFFSHQLRQSIERGRAAEGRPRLASKGAPSRFSWWSLGVAGSLASVFVAAALYYAMIPKPAAVAPSSSVAAAASHPELIIPAASPEEAPAIAPARRADGPLQMAKLEPDLQAQALDQDTSATALQYKAPNSDQDVQVIWTNGLEFQGDTPAPSPQ